MANKSLKHILIRDLDQFSPVMFDKLQDLLIQMKFWWCDSGDNKIKCPRCGSKKIVINQDDTKECQLCKYRWKNRIKTS